MTRIIDNWNGARITGTEVLIRSVDGDTRKVDRPSGLDDGTWNATMQPLVQEINILQTEAAWAASKVSPFEVSISEYNESCGISYWVVLRNKAIPHSHQGGDENPGYMTPYKFKEREHAVHTAAEFAAFFGVEPPEVCTCIMCKFK